MNYTHSVYFLIPSQMHYIYTSYHTLQDLLCFQVRHVIFLFCQFVNHIEVTRLPVYYPSQQEKDDPKLYATNVRRLMASEVYVPLEITL